ncbi:YbaY family lipoprotein [Halomonas halocynthiae]|uniref:YbaY family lipoprotein n=1 Tax=Halomonas halocynthiae TaxID=176290 RepID=UPI000419AEA5|nr:YbaY family lipoprotein [Halomonas halocynthiae]
MKKGHVLLIATLSASLILTACDSSKDADEGESQQPVQQGQSETDTAKTDQVSDTTDQSETPSQTLRLEGNVVFSATDIPVPDDAKLTISLRDVALADAPSVLIAKTTLTPGNQGPVSFQLEYDTSDITPNHSHALHGELRNAAGELLWVSASRHNVDAGKRTNHAPVTLTLEPVRAADAIGSMQDTQKSMLKPASGQLTQDDGNLEALDSQAENIQEPSAAPEETSDQHSADQPAADSEAVDAT